MHAHIETVVIGLDIMSLFCLMVVGVWDGDGDGVFRSRHSLNQHMNRVQFQAIMPKRCFNILTLGNGFFIFAAS